MLPALEFVRSVVATKLKSVPAEDAPDTLTLPLLLMFTSPAALAMRLAAFVLSAALDDPILPVVEVMFKVGVVMVASPQIVISPSAVSDTELPPLTAPAR